MTATPQAKNREIEHLRALAIALTLCQHLPLLFPWPQPPVWLQWFYDHLAFWIGVDLFFVISGFVVAQSLLNAFAGGVGATDITTNAEDAARRATRWREVKRFWLRRAFRLFPMAWLGVLLVLAASAWCNDSGIFGSLADNAYQALWIFLYVYNWFVYPLFAAGTNIAPLGVYWSLAVEEQFYLLLPLLLLWLKPRWLLGLIAIGIGAQFFLWRPAPWQEPLWGLRFDGLLWGVLLAYLVRSPRFQRWRVAATFSTALTLPVNLLLLAAILLLPLALFKLAFTTGLVAVICFLYVGLASVERGFVFVPPMMAGPADWLGARSYAIYVLHVPAFMLARELIFRLARYQEVQTDWRWAPGSIALGLVLTMAAATVCHRAIELPLRARGRELAKKIN